MYSASIKKVRFVARRMKPLSLAMGSLSGIGAGGSQGIAALKDDTGREWTVAEVISYLDAGLVAFVVGTGLMEAHVKTRGFGPRRSGQTGTGGAPDNSPLLLPTF